MSGKSWDVWIGFDPREAHAFAVARDSLRRFHKHMPIMGLVLSELRRNGVYTRPHEKRLGRMWDPISEAYMSTEFAVTRFLVPHLGRQYGVRPYGWTLFMDCDVLIRGSLSPLFESLDDTKAVYVVKHEYEPSTNFKMDGQVQQSYPRKNWSSVMAFNLDHPANERLTPEKVNTLPGRDLHRFCWLSDDLIGELSPKWNYLVGETVYDGEPTIVHFTNGIPTMPGCANVPYADEWLSELEQWAA